MCCSAFPRLSSLPPCCCFEVHNPISQHAAWDALTIFLVRANLGTSANKNAAMIHPSTRPRMGGGEPIADDISLQIARFDRRAAIDARFLRTTQ